MSSLDQLIIFFLRDMEVKLSATIWSVDRAIECLRTALELAKSRKIKYLSDMTADIDITIQKLENVKKDLEKINQTVEKLMRER